MFLELLLPFNQAWAQHASALIIILSDTLIESKPVLEPTPAQFTLREEWVDPEALPWARILGIWILPGKAAHSSTA